MGTEQRKTLCNRDCPDACSIVATVEDGRITRLAGDPDHPVTQGFLCHRTSQFLSTQYSPDRLLTPLLRQGGELRPVTWEAAMDVAAEGLLRIRAESGPAAIFHYQSGGSLGLLAYLNSYFFEQFGPVTVKRGDICSGAGDAAQLEDFGEEDSSDVFELLNARSIILWGKNVFTSSPHLIPILRQAQEKGARITVIDPLHTKTVSLADTFIQLRPGGDYALAMAVARVLFERGWTDPTALERCDHREAFEALARSRAVADWCAEADVDQTQAERIARELTERRPTTLLVGWGMGRRANGAAIVRAIDALGAITGNVGVPGAGVSFYFKRRGAFDTSFVKGAAVAPRTLCEPLFGQELMAQRDPPIRAVWIAAGNPVAMLPDSRANAAALRSRELVVVVDSWLSDTAREATLVLPTTTLLEADDLLGSYGHHMIGVARPVVPPPPGAKSDLEIIQLLAQRVGLADVLAGTAREWKARMLSPRLAREGITLETLEAGSIRNPTAPRLLFEGGRFATPSGRANLMHQAAPAGQEVPSADFPLTLMAISTERSQSSQWVRVPEGLAVVTVHPEATPGLSEGDEAVLESRLGSMSVRVKHDPRQRRDLVLMPKGGHLSRGQCANALIRARLTDMGEGGAINDERVRLYPKPAAAP